MASFVCQLLTVRTFQKIVRSHTFRWGLTARLCPQNNFSSLPTSSVSLSRLTMPDHANPNGTIHGGVILDMIDEVGLIASTKYCNTADPVAYRTSGPSITSVARVERMVFQEPIFVGEIVDLEAEVIYTSKRSLLVEVKVYAENILKGTKRFTNKARIWYVPVNPKNPSETKNVPPMTYRCPDEEQRGYQSYLACRSDRTCSILEVSVGPDDPKAAPYTVAASQTSTLYLVQPSNCMGTYKYCRGGAVMKWMDEFAGLVAMRHCRSNLATISLEATNFLHKCKLGDGVMLHGRVTFTSNNSVEVQCLADVHTFTDGDIRSARAAEALFTFVCFNRDGKIVPVPPLQVKTAEEKNRFESGMRRYELRKELEV